MLSAAVFHNAVIIKQFSFVGGRQTDRPREREKERERERERDFPLYFHKKNTHFL